MTFQRGEWIVYSVDGPRTGRVESDEQSIGVIVEDQDTAVRHLVARYNVRPETELERDKREHLGYYAQDLS